MKISVIIPIHDLEKEIVECLNSVAAQDFDKREYEILAVLDNCSDGTEAVINAWRGSHPDVDIKTFAANCGSPGGARNVGLDNASGEYVLFIDGDDYLMDGSAMTVLYNAVQGHNAVRATKHGVNDIHGDFSKRLTLWLHFFSRELIGDSRFTDMLLNEDFEFVKRIRNKAGYDEVTVSTPLYFYNYDRQRMLDRIHNVVRLSCEREQQGLPPLCVFDEFIRDDVDEETRRKILACRNEA